MARSIDYRSSSRYPADEVYAVMTDPDFLKARLERLGGPGAALLDHAGDHAGARYRVRHGLDARELPSMVRSFLAGDLVIERHERWTREASGRYTGEVDVTIRGTPASAAGGMRLHDVDAGGSELLVRADARVDVPFIGGRIEEVIAEQVRNLLTAETAFTLEWLSR
ncbi:MAG TPA: DUF2505 domain-containing protein [Pseudonocardia sp.]|jgi:hypothetical protein|nr:DUF2505 domain-containing protein [Pseudonocardia sp.]